MKPTLRLLALFILLCSVNARAAHNSGGQLRYEYDGTKYTFHAILYSECTSAGFLDSIVMKYHDAAQTITSQIKLYKKSTEIVAMPCPGSSNKCTNPSSNMPGYMKYVYEGTIPASTLAAAGDWVFSLNECCRGMNVNLFNASGSSMYLEAGIITAIGANSNANVPTITPIYLPIGGTVVVPVQLTDPDGDSLVIQPCPAQQALFANVPYPPGYSTASPLGATGSYSINQANGTMTIKAPSMSGAFTLAFRVFEYRNGQLVGYHMREFKVASIPATGTPKYSYPFPQSPIQVAYACPGAAGSASASFIDSVSTDSVFVQVDTPALPGWNFNVTTTNGSPTGAANITWTAPAGLNPATLPHFYIKVKVWDDGCPRANTEYAILVKTQQCPTDSVWPGDANDDNVANLVDVLAVAVAFGQTGPVRPGATTAWTPQWSANWGSNYPFTTTNIKHGDCNGDGVINLGDLGAIATNFGLTHPKGTPRNKTTGAPDLYFDITNVVAAPGKTIAVPLVLGSTAASLDNVYGLSAAVGVTGVTLAAPATLAAPQSWIGNSNNTLMFNKDVNNNTIMWAFSRTDHMNAKGNGQVATLTLTIPAGTPIGSKIKLDMNDVTIVDNNGYPVPNPYNVLDAEMTVVAANIGNTHAAIQSAAVIPNPSHGSKAQLFLQLSQQEQLNITIADVTGKIMYKNTETLQQGSHYVALPATLVSGMYTIQLHTAGGTPQTLKWVNQ